MRNYLFLPVLFFGATLLAAPVLSERDRDRLKKETIHAIDLIQRYHYKQTPFQDIPSADLLNKYLEDIDGTKLFLLQEDVDFVLQRFESSLKPSYLFTGDLYPAFEIYKLYHERAYERLAWVQNRMAQPFDFSREDAYQFDRRDVAWSESRQAADELWERRLTHELILELLENEPMERALETITRRYERMARFLDDVEVHNVQETFLTALASLYDPHSNFFSWDSAQEFDIQISNALVGIGAQLRDTDGYCVIERLMPGGPAEMSGQLHPGDKIVAVAQGSGEPVDVVGMKLRRIVQLIRGAEGSEVRLSILPSDSPTRREVVLIRERVELTANLARAEIFDVPHDGDAVKRIGVIELPSFYGEGSGEGSISTSSDVAELIRKLEVDGMQGLVLDLRRNGGGRLDEAIKLSGLFMPRGPVVMKRSFDGKIEEDWDRSGTVVWNGPLTILVSRSSASASEIVAGALQSLGRAVVVGDPATHGKGTVQAPISLRNAMRSIPFSRSLNVGTVKITVQQFFLPNGASTQSRGVSSDIVLPSTSSLSMEGEGDLDNALAWDEIPPIQYQLVANARFPLALVGDDLMAQLRDRSSLRQQQLTEFDFLNRQVEWVRERRDRKEASLNLEERRQEKELTEVLRIAFDNERKSLGRQLAWNSRAVKLDLTDARDRAHQRKLAETPLPNGSPRANQFYQKVFYFQQPGEDKIHEIWVEYFNYDRALAHAPAIAGVLSEQLGITVQSSQVDSVLTRLRNTDRGGEFNVLVPFREVLGESVAEEDLSAAMPAFFTKLVELDPDVLLERPLLDVQLRESLRITADWLALRGALDDVPLAAAKADIPVKE